jgi:DNA sulfur modification protein DndE
VANSLSLVDVAGANFRTDDRTDEANTRFMTRLGVKVRYMPARLALARSLAIEQSPPKSEEGDQGKTIKGDTLFGTGPALASWTALIVQRMNASDVDIKSLQECVSAHWRRGIGLLEEDWKASGEEAARFIRRLVEAADLRTTTARLGGAADIDDIEAGPIIVPVGEMAEDTTTGEIIEWRLNGPGGSPHSGIMGGVGSGKTRTAVAMLKTIRSKIAVPLLAFDFKGDLGEPQTSSSSYRLDRIFDGRTVRPPLQAVPLDVLHVQTDSEHELAFAAQRFQESFANLKGSGVGTRQQGALFDATLQAFRTKKPCRLADIRDALKAVYAQRGMAEDGAIATMEAICRFPLFEPTEQPDVFFQKSWIISLPAQLPEQSRGIVVNLLLDALDRYLNSLTEAPTDALGNRIIRNMCVVDEAHRILGARLPGLSSLIRQSRSKGGAIMLISQSPDDFSGEEDDFLNEMGLVVAFATNAKPAAAGRVLGKGTNLTSLAPGECYLKRRGDSNAKRIVAWKT